MAQNLDNERFFKENGFLIIRNFIEKDFVEFIQDYFSLKINSSNYTIDSTQVEYSYRFYGDNLAETILQNSCESLSKIIGIQILPTYSLTRFYMKGDELKIHKDRPSCEISATLSLGFSDDCGPNPIYFSKNKNGSNPTEIILNSGDLCIYRGCDLYHWRNPLPNKWMLQSFLHFINSEGKYIDNIYDKRVYLGFEELIDNS
jgi:hypothetical protein